MIVFLGDRILGGKPEILFRINRIIEAGSCKAADGLIRIMNSLDHARSFKVMNRFTDFRTILCGINKLCLSFTGNLDFNILIYIPIGMSCNGDGLRPVLYIRNDSLYQNRRTEYGSVQNRADRSVRTLPHFLQMIFGHSGCIRRNRCTLYGNPVFLRCFRTIYRYLIVGFVPMFQTKIIILGFQINKGKKKLLLNHLP